MSEWFTSLVSQATQLADSIVDTVVQTASAAQEEILEQQRMQEENNKFMSPKTRLEATSRAALPWEAEEESLAILSQDVMERILKLSLSERNFTIDPTTIFPPEGNPTQVAFDFEEFVPVAMKIMSVDANLTQMHAKVCPKMDSEEIFWRNYYYRLRYIRGAYGLEGQAVRDAYKPINESVLIFAPVFVYTEPDSIMETPVGDKSGKSLMYSTPVHSSKNSGGGNSSSNSSKRQSPLSNTNSPLPDRENASYETTPSSLYSCSLSPENGGGGGGGEQSKISPEEERRKTDEAKLAAEVEAELENAYDLDLEEDLDLDDLGDINIDDVDEDGSYDDLSKDLDELKDNP